MSEERYRLHAYVCGARCTRPPRTTSWAKFETLFTQRPDGCRYGVFETTAGAFGAWDFFDDSLLYGPPLNPPVPVETGPTLDGVLMRMVMCHEK